LSSDAAMTKKVFDKSDDDDDDEDNVVESFDDTYPNFVFDDFDDEDETEDDDGKYVGDDLKIKQNENDLAKLLNLKYFSEDTHSKYNGRRNLPDDLLRECVKSFASVPEESKKSFSYRQPKPPQPHTLFLVKDAESAFPGKNIKSLTKDQISAPLLRGVHNESIWGSKFVCGYWLH
jgi:hypothetical protein